MRAKDIDYDFVVEKYWDTIPAWSTVDLAEYYDCDPKTIWCFMKKNDIPIRNKSDANINRWICDFKREATIEGMKKDGERRSNLMKENWKNPVFREMMIKNNTEMWNKPEYREHLTKICKERYHNTDNPLRKLNENKGRS